MLAFAATKINVNLVDINSSTLNETSHLGNANCTTPKEKIDYEGEIRSALK